MNRAKKNENDDEWKPLYLEEKIDPQFLLDILLSVQWTLSINKKFLIFRKVIALNDT